jgi:Flp pilus assembly protein TadD
MDPAALESLALDNAAKALELDPKSTQAHLATAAVHRVFWRWNEAVSAYEKAYELSPNDIRTLGNFGGLLSWAGHHERAIRLLERAVQLDPAAPGSRFNLGVALAEAGRPAAAVAVLREASAIAPAAIAVRHWLALTEAAAGDAAQALVDLQAVERLSRGWPNPTTPTGLLYSYSRIGRSEDVARLVNDVKAMAASGSIGAGTWALMYLALDDFEQAFHWLNVAVEKTERHEPDPGFLNLMTIKTNPHANPALDEPRFRALRDRIGALD